MEIPLKSALINYYAHLETTHRKWDEFVENVKRPCQALKNQSEQYCHVISKEVDNAEICKLKDVRERLVYQIISGIENEVSLILNELRRLKNYVEDLKTKFHRLEIARRDALPTEPSFKQLIDGTPRIPRLDLLMEFSIVSRNHHSELFMDIFENFRTLDYKNHESVRNWVKSIDRLQRDNARIQYIMGLTNFLINEPVK